MDRTETYTELSGLRYYRDWDMEGAVVMENPRTLQRYVELRNMHPDCDECGVFFAFSTKQFNENYQHLVMIGKLVQGEKVIAGNGGLYGKREGLKAFHDFYEGIEEKIKEECDPQEVYFYEYNNRECMIDWDGDKEAFRLVQRIFGKRRTSRLTRFCNYGKS